MRIELRRHSLKGEGEQKDMLSPEGIELARHVGAEQMRGKGYTHLVVTRWFRTAHTAAAMAEGAGDFTCAGLTVSSALDSRRGKDWGEYFKQHGMNIIRENALVISESERMATEFRALCSSLPGHANLLGIGHTPFVECLVLGLTGNVFDPFRECEGVILDFDEKFTLVKLLLLVS